MAMIATRAEILVALGRSTSATDAELSLIDMLHPLAESVLIDWLGKDPTYQQHVEYLPLGLYDVDRSETLLDDVKISGNRVIFDTNVAGSSILQLANTPVWLSGLTIYEDIGAYANQSSGAFPSTTLLTEGTDYYLDVDDATNNLSHTGHVHRFGSWPTDPRSVKVTYWGGETAARMNGSTAGAIKLAAILTVEKAFYQFKEFQSSAAGPKTSESIGKYSYSRGLANVFAGGGFTVPYEAQRILMPYRSYAGLFG